MKGDWFLGSIAGEEVLFTGNESLHLAKVMRKKVGDHLVVFDGKGRVGEAKLTYVHSKNSRGTLLSVEEHKPTTRPLTLAVAPTKNIDRFEFILEKGTELGVSKFVPLLCFHSERKKINLERCRRIILAAAKQSRKAYVPELLSLTSLTDFINITNVNNRYIAHCASRYNVKDIQQVSKQEPSCVLIGPEGDFSEKEIEAAIKQDFTGVRLSANRLRTETAAMAVAAFWDYAQE